MRVLFVVTFLVLAGPVTAQDEGTLFQEKACVACHGIGVDPPQKVGPNLNGVVGRIIGSIEGYDYSNALLEAGRHGEIWTRTALLRYLKKPSHIFPGTKMTFFGMNDRAEIEALIDYLARFDSDGESTD